MNAANDDNRDAVRTLADRYLAGDLDDAGLARLEELLARPDGAQTFWRCCELDASLEWEFGQVRAPALHRLGRRDGGPTARRARTAFFRIGLPAAAAGLLLAIGLVRTSAPASSPVSARIAFEEDARWDPAHGARNGLELGVEYRLVGGWCFVRTGSGASAVVHGPAAFTLESPTRLRLDEGLVTVYAPTARAGEFVVETAAGTVTDFGTRFAVRARVGGATRAFVREGRVAVSPAVREGVGVAVGGSRMVLPAGAGAVAEGGRAVVSDDVSWMGSVVWPSDAEAIVEAGAESAEGRWLRRALPAVRAGGAMLWLDASPSGPTNRIGASGVSLSGGEPAGGAGPEIVRGRLDGGRAMRFGSSDGAVGLDIPGRFERLTISAWVRFRPGTLEPGYEHRGLVMSTLWGETGAAHWQAKDRDFRLTFAHPGREPHAIYDADRHDLHTGEWMMLATVYDAAEGVVTHLRNGSTVAVETMSGPRVPLRFGPTLVGSTLPPVGGGDAVRMGGELDDLILWPRALGEAELRELYEYGRPR